MIDITTKYMGLDLKSPVIASSSGLTSEINSLIKIEQSGAGAVILRSLFEEEILDKINSLAGSAKNSLYGREAAGYLEFFTKKESIDSYIDLLIDAKKNLSIPVIASVNCLSAKEWIPFASKMEEAGADAVEINVFRLPSDPDVDSETMEKIYFDVAREIKKQISIPVAFKMGYYFSSLGRMLTRISDMGIDGLVLFNRFVNFDININDMTIETGNIYSNQSDLSLPLRWAGIMSGSVKADIAISTGIHDYSGVVKALLSGASATYLSSTLYLNGINYIDTINQELMEWMKQHSFGKIEDFRGRLSVNKMGDAMMHERSQFLLNFTGHKI